MRPEDVRLDLPSIAHATEVLVIASAPFNIYENNVKTDKIGGIAYTCVMPMANFDKIVVKVADTNPVLTTDQIANQTYISFIGFESKFWKDKSGNYQLSCKAEKAILAGKGGKA